MSIGTWNIFRTLLRGIRKSEKGPDSPGPHQWKDRRSHPMNHIDMFPRDLRIASLPVSKGTQLKLTRQAFTTPQCVQMGSASKADNPHGQGSFLAAFKEISSFFQLSELQATEWFS